LRKKNCRPWLDGAKIVDRNTASWVEAFLSIDFNTIAEVNTLGKGSNTLGNLSKIGNREHTEHQKAKP